jgi:hypothetical protein
MWARNIIVHHYFGPEKKFTNILARILRKVVKKCTQG